MGSKYWDEKTAERYKAFRYEFPERALAGRVVVVAGGTGGLGAATVTLLAREGARVVVGYRANRQRAEALAKTVEKDTGQKIALVGGELVDPAVRRAYLVAAEKLGGAPAGAAIFPGDPARAKWEELDAATIEASLRANYVGPILLAKELGGAMAATREGGSVVLLGTMQAVATFEGSLNYAAPKAALVQAAKILAKQWKNVRVNVVAPGATVAGMAETSVSGGKYDASVESGAIERFGRPEDVARAVRFFLEPDNYVTGQVLVVDGGLTLRRDRG
ncbi:MAG TPA: SDR family oxidoreductase [Candidatus Acidoferrales bacterium]|nr:SDR family oxidoreductase [Candidatus Acidoferrales bacterium]